MANVVSRVNGLKIHIPSDARGVLHRFAIGGGGNELVFEPITRKAFEDSKSTESKPVSMGTGSGDSKVRKEAVELTENVKESKSTKKGKRTDPEPEI